MPAHYQNRLPVFSCCTSCVTTLSIRHLLQKGFYISRLVEFWSLEEYFQEWLPDNRQVTHGLCHSMTVTFHYLHSGYSATPMGITETQYVTCPTSQHRLLLLLCIYSMHTVLHAHSDPTYYHESKCIKVHAITIDMNKLNISIITLPCNVPLHLTCTVFERSIWEKHWKHGKEIEHKYSLY